MITIKNIQDRVKEAIHGCGLSQTELARRLNIKQSNISDYLKGKKSPSLETFANLCAILDLDTREMLCIDSFKED